MLVVFWLVGIFCFVLFGIFWVSFVMFCLGFLFGFVGLFYFGFGFFLSCF